MEGKRKNTGPEEQRKYATPEAFWKKCEAYFAKCDKEGKLYGEAGLALYLDVTLVSLRRWYDGERCPDLQDVTQRAYLRIQSQLESDPTYMDKGMVTKSIFMMKQPRLGGYQDRVEAKQDISVEGQDGRWRRRIGFQVMEADMANILLVLILVLLCLVALMNVSLYGPRGAEGAGRKV